MSEPINPDLILIKKVPELTDNNDPKYLLTANDNGDLVRTDYQLLKSEIVSGSKGEATPTSSPTAWAPGDPDLFEKWEVKTAGTYTNFKDSIGNPIIITIDDLKNYFVQIWVFNGVSEKVVSEKPDVTQSIPKFEELTFPVTYPTQATYESKLWQVKNGQTANSNDTPSSTAVSKWQAIIESKADTMVIAGKQLFNKLNAKSGVVAINNGGINASNNWINSDFIEIKGSTTYTGRGFTVPASSTTTAVFAFYDSMKNFISAVVSNGATTQTVTSPSNAKYTRMSLANVVGIGSNPTDNATVNTFMFVEGSSVGNYEKYDTYYIDKSSIKDKYPNFLVELIPFTGSYTGSLIDVIIAKVYERTKGDIYKMSYLKYTKLAYADWVSGDFEGGEIVRYTGTDLFQYDIKNNTFINLNIRLLTSNESEFVMNPGRWIGGYHGHEDLSQVYFVIDGKPYNTNGGVNFSAPSGLIKCNSFKYIQKSQLKMFGTNVPIADRVKEVDFNNGFQVKTKIKWLQSLTNVLMYPGISCIGKYFNSVVLDSGAYAVPTGSNNMIIDNETLARKATYGGLEYSLTVENRMPNSVQDGMANVKIWDRPSDTKYYRAIQSFNPTSGEVFETETKVTILVN